MPVGILLQRVRMSVLRRLFDLRTRAAAVPVASIAVAVADPIAPASKGPPATGEPSSRELEGLRWLRSCADANGVSTPELVHRITQLEQVERRAGLARRVDARLSALGWLSDNAKANGLEVPPSIDRTITRLSGERARLEHPLAGDRIDEAAPGTSATPALIAARWAAEAVGVDWTTFASTKDLKRAVRPLLEALDITLDTRPFFIKRQIMEHLGLLTARARPSSAMSKKDRRAVIEFSLEDLRARIAEREAHGLPRLGKEPLSDRPSEPSARDNDTPEGLLYMMRGTLAEKRRLGDSVPIVDRASTHRRFIEHLEAAIAGREPPEPERDREVVRSSSGAGAERRATYEQDLVARGGQLASDPWVVALLDAVARTIAEPYTDPRAAIMAAVGSAKRSDLDLPEQELTRVVVASVEGCLAGALTAAESGDAFMARHLLERSKRTLVDLGVRVDREAAAKIEQTAADREVARLRARLSHTEAQLERLTRERGPDDPIAKLFRGTAESLASQSARAEARASSLRAGRDPE